VALSIAAACLGVALVAAAIQGYVLGLGRIADGAAGAAVRALLAAGGLLLAIPAERLTGLAFHLNLALGAALAVLGLCAIGLIRKTSTGRTTP
jgi:hypothetical protein